MSRRILAWLALSSALTFEVRAQTADNSLPIRLSEQAARQEASRFLEAFDIPNVRCIFASAQDCGSSERKAELIRTAAQRLVEYKAVELVIPKAWDDIIQLRDRLVWLPASVVVASPRYISMLGSQTRERQCKRFSPALQECMAVVVTSAVSQPLSRPEESEGTGYSYCQVFQPQQDGQAFRLPADCQPMMMQFNRGDYFVRAVATTDRRSPDGSPIVPGFKGRALLFEYEFSSAISSELRSPSRVTEYINALGRAAGLPPLTLAVSRGDAENVIVAWSDRRYSSQFRVWEQINLIATTRHEDPRTANAAVRMTTTVRPRITISEQNVESPRYWHEPSDAQHQVYDSIIATQFTSGIKALCDGYEASIGRAAFSYDAGPVVSLKCKHRMQ